MVVVDETVYGHLIEWFYNEKRKPLNKSGSAVHNPPESVSFPLVDLYSPRTMGKTLSYVYTQTQPLPPTTGQFRNSHLNSPVSYLNCGELQLGIE